METATQDSTVVGPEPEVLDSPVDPAREPDQDQELEDVGLTMAGSTKQLSFNVGGREPTTSKLTVRGGAIELEGQFKKGQLVAVEVEVEVREVGFRDQVDAKTGTVIGCTRKQVGHIVGVRLKRH